MATKPILTSMAPYCLLFLLTVVAVVQAHNKPITSLPNLRKLSFHEGYTHVFEDSMLQHELDERKKVVAAVEAHHAISPLETYWHSVLPNTTMPNAIHNLIDPVMKTAKNRVHVRQGMTQQLFVLSGELPSADYIRSTFFPLKNMYPKAQMNQGLNFDRTIVGAAFVPRTEADHLRFSSDNLPRILDHFSMVRDSDEAKQIEEIIKDCEEPCLIGEKKFCSTSLELMIDNIVSLLGTTNIEAFSTTVRRNNMIAQQDGKALYTVSTPIKKILYNSRLVVCHQEPSPQAVHYCHTNIRYQAFVVPLIGNDGSKVNAVAVCHHDAINFNPLFLELLDVEAGVEPVCHFLPENHLIWVSSEAMSKAVDMY